jgi:hypothetical protein
MDSAVNARVGAYAVPLQTCDQRATAATLARHGWSTFTTIHKAMCIALQ